MDGHQIQFALFFAVIMELLGADDVVTEMMIALKFIITWDIVLQEDLKLMEA